MENDRSRDMTACPPSLKVEKHLSGRLWPLVLVIYASEMAFVMSVNFLLRYNSEFRFFYQTPIGFSLFLVLLPLWMLLIAFGYNALVFKVGLKELFGEANKSLSGACAVSAFLGLGLALIIGGIAHFLNSNVFPFRHFSVVGVAGAGGAFFEECLFRGFFFVLLSRRFAFVTVVGMISILSLAFHFRSLNQPLLLFLALVCVNICSMMLRRRFNSLAPPICFHAMYNVIVASV